MKEKISEAKIRMELKKALEVMPRSHYLVESEEKRVAKYICNFFITNRIQNTGIYRAILGFLRRETYLWGDEDIDESLDVPEAFEKHWDKAEEMRQKVITELKEVKPSGRTEEMLYNLLLGWMQSDSVAIKHIQKAIDLCPDEKMLHYILGGIYWSYAEEKYDTQKGYLTNDEKFIERCLKAIEELGKSKGMKNEVLHDVHVHDRRGRILEKLGRYEEAEVEFKKTVELAPDHGSWYMLKEVCQALGRYEEGLRHHLKIHPRNRSGWAKPMSLLLEGLSSPGKRECFNQAVELFEALIRERPKAKDPDLYAYLALSYRGSSRPDKDRKALHYAKQAVKHGERRSAFLRILKDIKEENEGQQKSPKGSF